MRMLTNTLLAAGFPVALALLVVVSCDSQPPASPEQSNTAVKSGGKNESGRASTDESDQRELAIPEQAWIDGRVEKARSRLAQSKAGELVWRSIEYHGGLETWYANGPIYFRFDYRPLGEGTERDTYNTVDTWSSRARQQLADDREVEFGWDGAKAWVAPEDAELKINARFWALTPYYFVAMPFVLADPGVKLERQGTAELKGETYDVVKATFGENVGDSPDDYYVVYLHSETGRLGALRYIVSYPGFFPDGGHSPPKLMIYEGEVTADGITLAETYPTYSWDPDKSERGDKVTAIEMSDFEFRPDTPGSYFDPPQNAHIIDGYTRSNE